MPDYEFPDNGVQVTIPGKILDERFTRILLKETDLRLDLVVALDAVQKGMMADFIRVKIDANFALYAVEGAAAKKATLAAGELAQKRAAKKKPKSAPVPDVLGGRRLAPRRRVDSAARAGV